MKLNSFAAPTLGLILLTTQLDSCSPDPMAGVPSAPDNYDRCADQVRRDYGHLNHEALGNEVAAQCQWHLQAQGTQASFEPDPSPPPKITQPSGTR